MAIDYLKRIQRPLPDILKRLSEVDDYRNPKKIKHKGRRYSLIRDLIVLDLNIFLTFCRKKYILFATKLREG